MSQMSKYCKAISIETLKEFKSWPEDVTRLLTAEASSSKPSSGYLFVHDDFRLTRSIFLDEDIILNNPTSDWVAFCKDKLQLEVPQF
jgi:hypothetical protein